MQERVGELVIELTRSPSPKFTAPLLLLHGLWGEADVWRRWAGFLAHRGWSCHALNLRGRGADARRAGRLEDYEADVRQAVAAMDAPPIIVGHDLGGLLALRLAAGARAVVVLAPWVARPHANPSARALLGVLGPLRLRLRRSLPAPRVGGRAYCGDPWRASATESTAVLGALLFAEITLPTTPSPKLIVAGGRDPFVPVAAAERLAHATGADLLVDPAGGHLLPVEGGWERRAGRVHRWCIQALGDPLLALREEEEEGEE